MSETLSVSQRTIERDLSYLQNNGILMHEGKVNDGAWVIVKNVNPKLENPIAKQIDDCQII
jgi:DeoR/GlpR family transcriptional regulator of sugar metabolism